MNPTSQQREQIRLCLLRYCLSPGGCSPGLLLSNLRGEGFSRIELEQVQLEIDYLEGKNLIAVRPGKLVSPENKLWKITSAGTDYLAGME